jgi:TDG/mug DNA glycosylase family protein
VLPDVLRPHLDIVFCGTAAGAVSARKGAYYAGPGNAFWPTLFDVGLVPHPVAAHEYPLLMQWNMGFTDLAKHASGSDSSLARENFDVQRLRDVIVQFRPRIVAFTGKRAAAEFVGHPVPYGLLVEPIGASHLFVLPSPSGAARGHWDVAPWRRLADWRAWVR